MTTYPHLTRQIEDLGLQLEGVSEILQAIGNDNLSDRIDAAAHIVAEVMRDLRQGTQS